MRAYIGYQTGEVVRSRCVHAAAQLPLVDWESHWDKQDHGERADTKLVTRGQENHSEPVTDHFSDLALDFFDINFVEINFTNAVIKRDQEEGLDDSHGDDCDKLERVTNCSCYVALEEKIELATGANFALIID